MGYTKKRKSTTRRKMRGGQRYVQVKNTNKPGLKWIPNPNWGDPTGIVKAQTFSTRKAAPAPTMQKLNAYKQRVDDKGNFKKKTKRNKATHYSLYKGKWVTASQKKKAEEAAKVVAPSKTVKASVSKPITAATAQKITQRAKTMRKMESMPAEDRPSLTAFSEEEE